jgi:ATP-dependent Clp protease adapter protein ClpS
MTTRRERSWFGFSKPRSVWTVKDYPVMTTAHRNGACVIAVFARDIAETKTKEATELGRAKGYTLFFSTEPEE